MFTILIFLFGLGMIVAPASEMLGELMKIGECKAYMVQYLQISPALVSTSKLHNEMLSKALIPELIVSCETTPESMLLKISDQLGINAKYEIILPEYECGLKDGEHSINDLERFYYDLADYPSYPQFILRPYKPKHDTNIEFSEEYKDHVCIFELIYELCTQLDCDFEIKGPINLKTLVRLFFPVSRVLYKTTLSYSVEDVFEEYWNYKIKLNDSIRPLSNGRRTKSAESKIRHAMPELVRHLAKYIVRLRYDYERVKNTLKILCSLNPIIEVLLVGFVQDDTDHGFGFQEDNIDELWANAYFHATPIQDYYDDPEELEIVQVYWDLLRDYIKQEYESLLRKYHRHKWSKVPHQSGRKMDQSLVIRGLDLAQPAIRIQWGKVYRPKINLRDILNLDPAKSEK